MDTIDKSEYPDVFSKYEEMYKEDIEFFATIFKKKMPEKERYFFKKMKEKVEGVFAPSADIIARRALPQTIAYKGRLGINTQLLP